MTPSPEIKPLSRARRRLVFLFSVLLFIVGVPALVFYAIGYRIDLSGETRNIRSVGGLYISAEVNDIGIYLDDEPVEDMRIFLNAAYIQNLNAGLHQVHVQGAGITTWIKDLPVFAHFVTEAASFNMPSTPQVRLVTPYLTEEGASVVSLEATSTFAFASSTNLFYATSSVATSTYEINPEYTYLSTLFASTTASRAYLKRKELEQSKRFRFPGETVATATTTNIEPFATTTKNRGDMTLVTVGDEVVARWVNDREQPPYYFCATYLGANKTAELYGVHVMDELRELYAGPAGMIDTELIGSELCRSSIRIDRKWQSVQYFDFLPKNQNLVLLQLQDGVYVVEIDDRSWQNVQLLYPGDYLTVLVDSASIFIKDGEYILQVFTEVQE